MANLLGSVAGAAISKLFGPAVGTVAGTGINSLAAALQNAAKLAGGSTTTGASNPLDSSAQTTNNNQTQQDSAPTPNTTLPNVPQISWDDALGQARGYYEPQYDSAVLAQNKMASDQQNALVQALSARGYANARGGHRQVGEGNITQQHAMGLDNLRNSFNASVNALAREIYTEKSSKAQQEQQNQLALQMAKNKQDWDTWNVKNQTALQKGQIEASRQNNRDNVLWNIIGLLYPDLYAKD